VRHGRASGYSQLSQRYVDESHAAFVMPPASSATKQLEAEWQRVVADAQAAYVRAVEGLMERYDWVTDKVHRRKMAREAARSVLPNATEVKIVVSGNARAWRTMLELRCSEGAELEIRRMAIACLRELQREGPALFSDFRDLCRGRLTGSGARRVSQSLRSDVGKKSVSSLLRIAPTRSYWSTRQRVFDSRTATSGLVL